VAVGASGGGHGGGATTVGKGGVTWATVVGRGSGTRVRDRE
jgi:hypothetical protein